MSVVDLSFIEQAVSQHGRTPDAVIPLLQAVQDHYGYLPEEALRRICESTQITPAAIGGVSTFYDMFRHQPAGEHIVHVCHGTACHVKVKARQVEAKTTATASSPPGPLSFANDAQERGRTADGNGIGAGMPLPQRQRRRRQQRLGPTG